MLKFHCIGKRPLGNGRFLFFHRVLRVMPVYAELCNPND
nr:MAG TPA: hypothetical protein [Caudoviricetes sp.]